MIVRHCDANAQEDRVEPRLQVGQRHFAVDDKDSMRRWRSPSHELPPGRNRDGYG